MKKLSEVYKNLPLKYGYCFNCKEFFIDDIPMYGSLMCPKCKWALYRGLEKPIMPLKMNGRRNDLRTDSPF